MTPRPPMEAEQRRWFVLTENGKPFRVSAEPYNLDRQGNEWQEVDVVPAPDNSSTPGPQDDLAESFRRGWEAGRRDALLNPPDAPARGDEVVVTLTREEADALTRSFLVECDEESGTLTETIVVEHSVLDSGQAKLIAALNTDQEARDPAQSTEGESE